MVRAREPRTRAIEAILSRVAGDHHPCGDDRLAASDQSAQPRADAARAAVETYRALGGGWNGQDPNRREEVRGPGPA